MSSRSLLVCQRSFGGQKQVVRNDQQHDAQGREQRMRSASFLRH